MCISFATKYDINPILNVLLRKIEWIVSFQFRCVEWKQILNVTLITLVSDEIGIRYDASNTPFSC